jgi:DNA recombination protein RmuC|tara:strand:- start:69 stop:1163 length:1095 start_codon:yes stop_codon:yes gene_type:complete
MDSLLIILVGVLILISLVILYFQLKAKPKQEENPTEKIQEEINSLRNSLNESFGSMSKDMAKDFTASFGSMTKEIAKDMTGALTKVDEKVAAFNTQVENLNKSQEGITKVLAGVKKYGTLAEFSLDALIKDLLPASQYLTNVKMKEDTGENVEFAIKLQGDVLVPVDSHFPVEKFKAIDDAYQADDKKAAAEARTKLARAFRDKAKSVNEKYIVPPKSTDFAIVYAPTESLFSELTSYQDPTTKELLTQELMQKYKVVILGPNTLSAYLQSLHMGFQTLKVQKHATEIYDHLKTISTRFSKHFEGVILLRKKLEEAMSVVDKFGTDARSITRTLENIKDPGQIEIAAKDENVEKFEDHSKQLKN